MIYENFKHFTTDQTIKSVIGMSREKFDGLVPNFSAAYQKIQEERYQNKRIKRLPKGEKPGVFSSHEERLFFVFFYLKTYPTFDVLGFHFGLSAGQAHDYVELFLRVLERALTDLGKLPEVTLETPEDLSQLVDQYNDIILMGSRWPAKKNVIVEKNAIP